MEETNNMPALQTELLEDEREKRMDTISSLRMRGASVPAIAKSLGVSTATIYRDIKELGRRYREEIIKTDPVTLIADHLHWLDEMETVALHEIATSNKKIQKVVDPSTGVVTEVEVVDPNKSKFHSAALKARDMKIKLMMDTGIIPKNVPEKLFDSLEQNQDTEQQLLDEQRTPDEIRASIKRLLKHGRRM